MSHEIKARDIALSIGGTAFRFGDVLSFEAPAVMPEGVEYIELTPPPRQREIAYEVTCSTRGGFDLSKILALLHRPRPKRYTVFYESGGAAHHMGTITAWTPRGVRRRLRRMLHTGPGDVTALYAFDWCDAREERHPSGTITLTADCIHVARPQMATAWARRTACEVSL